MRKRWGRHLRAAETTPKMSEMSDDTHARNPCKPPRLLIKAPIQDADFIRGRTRIADVGHLITDPGRMIIKLRFRPSALVGKSGRFARLFTRKN